MESVSETLWRLLFQVVTRELLVDEGGESPLSSQNLLLSDVDSREEDLQVQLKAGPRHGALRMGPAPLEGSRFFTVKDLQSLGVRSDAASPSRASRAVSLEMVAMVSHRLPPQSVSCALRYSHDGSETLEDRMEFTATDGTNALPFVLKVKVTPLLLVLTSAVLTAGPSAGEPRQR